MKLFLVIVGSMLTAVRANRPWYPNSRPLIPANVLLFSDGMNDFINNQPRTTWQAGHNYHEIQPDYFKHRLGAKKNTYQYPSKQAEEVQGLPDNFDARQKWPNCPSIDKVRDQGKCSVCWAFSAAEAMSDRICAASQGSVQVEISVNNLVSCCENCAESCQDGFPSKAWQYWVKYGIVTGGIYNSSEGCQPYPYAPCSHSAGGQCAGSSPATLPQCKGICDNRRMNYQQEKHYGEEFYFVHKNERNMRSEIFKHGPVQSEITLYEDFIHYKSGIYQQYSQREVGTHAVRIIGWGVENGTPYWLAVNTWGTDWGDQGRFKIIRGENECGIESSVTAGIPKPYGSITGGKD